MTYFLFSLFFLLLLPIQISHAADSSQKKLLLRWPTDASRILTSTFGEYRPDRFHAGIDIRTNGNTGYPCYAVDDGDIIRVKINFNGYGKALYLQLEDGRIAVYAHLDRFYGKLEKEIRQLQQEAGCYQVETFYKSGEHHLNRGDLLAYSGDTGSGPPHLHFELRKGMNRPYNPVMEGFSVEDTRPPTIRALAMKPLDTNSEVEGDILPVIREFARGQVNPVSFYGKVGLAVNAVDFQNASHYALGVSRIELFVDDELQYVFQPDSFDYQFNIQNRLDFDFELERRGFQRFHRLYLLPKNQLYFYRHDLTGGFLDSRILGDGVHTVLVRVFDDAQNSSEVEWKISALSEPTFPPAEPSDAPSLPLVSDSIPKINIDIDIISTLFRVTVSNVPIETKIVRMSLLPFGGFNELKKCNNSTWIGRLGLPLSYQGEGNLRISASTDSGVIAAGFQRLNFATMKAGETLDWYSPDSSLVVSIGQSSLWFDLVARLEKSAPIDCTITPIYSLFPQDHPFAGEVTLRFNSRQMPWSDAAVLVYREKSKNGIWTALETHRSPDGFTLETKVLSFEDFSVMLDTLPPRIENPFPQENALLTTTTPRIRATVEDNLSGLDLDNCDLLLDGYSTIWVYDPDKKEICYESWDPLPSGAHRWDLIISDRVGNTVATGGTFIIRTE